MINSRTRLSRICFVVVVALLGSILIPKKAFAHPGIPPAPHDLWERWEWNAVILFGIMVTIWIYQRGVLTLGKRRRSGQAIEHKQAIAFIGGITAIFVALISPLDALGSALFSAHMAQHLILMLVAAPLLAFGTPTIIILWGLPKQWRLIFSKKQLHEPFESVWRVMGNPLVIWSLHVAATWLWHLPSLYQATLQSDFIHSLQHSSFLGTALLYWWSILHPSRKKAMSYGIAIISLFGMAVQSSVLGALLTFSESVWYPAYDLSVAAWGLTALQDQQLAGVVMWVPPGILYLLAVMGFVDALLEASDKSGRRRQTSKLKPEEPQGI